MTLPCTVTTKGKKHGSSIFLFENATFFRALFMGIRMLHLLLQKDIMSQSFLRVIPYKWITDESELTAISRLRSGGKVIIIIRWLIELWPKLGKKEWEIKWNFRFFRISVGQRQLYVCPVPFFFWQGSVTNSQSLTTKNNTSYMGKRHKVFFAIEWTGKNITLRVCHLLRNTKKFEIRG